ncbi:sensor histidine kinase [Metabacillus sp. HB246100]
MTFLKKAIYSLTLKSKVRLLFAGILCVTIIFSFLFIHYLYRNLYVKDVEESLVSEGQKLSHYYSVDQIPIEDYPSYISWYNSISESEVLFIDNPRELSACLPFEINHQALITEQERRQLLTGEHLIKVGYEERFDRKIMGVVIPLLDNKSLSGILYLYLPLSPITEVFNQSTPLLIAVGVVFFLLTFFIVNRMSHSFLQPIHEMKQYANDLAKGQFSKVIPVQSQDEIGKLAETFNYMSKALHETDIRKKEFLANVAHELRTPLSYVKGYSEVLQEGLYETEDEARKYLILIQQESERMKRLVNDLLDLAQLESTHYQLVKMPIVFSQLILDTLERFNYRIKEKELQITVSLDDEIIINGNEDRLQQIVYNLIENAIRYTNSQGKITLILREEKEKIHFSIADNGIGMTKVDIEQIGQRFFRSDKARNRKEGGTGLGLAIVKQLVHLHGGTLEVESEVGEGTKFSLFFPLYNEEER